MNGNDIFDVLAIPMSRHDYGDGCFSFGYDYDSPVMEEARELRDFSFKVTANKYGRRTLNYCSEDNSILLHPFTNVDEFIIKYDEHLIPRNGYNYEYMAMCTQFVIHERGDYIYIMDFDDIASAFAMVYRVRRDDYFKAYNEYLASIGVDPVEY